MFFRLLVLLSFHFRRCFRFLLYTGCISSMFFSTFAFWKEKKWARNIGRGCSLTSPFWPWDRTTSHSSAWIHLGTHKIGVQPLVSTIIDHNRTLSRCHRTSRLRIAHNQSLQKRRGFWYTKLCIIKRKRIRTQLGMNDRKDLIVYSWCLAVLASSFDQIVFSLCFLLWWFPLAFSCFRPACVAFISFSSFFFVPFALCTGFALLMLFIQN